MAQTVSQALEAPFVWGAGGEALTPDEVKRRRERADAMRRPAGYTPQGWWSLLGALAGEGVARYKESSADRAEREGRAAATEGFKAARESGNYLDAMADPWLTPQQASVASALQGRAWDKEDQAAQWAREDARAAASARAAAAEAAKPKWQTLESGGDVYRYNANDPNSRPELFFDGPDAPGEAFTLSDGQVRYAPDGSVIAGRPNADTPKTAVVNGQLVNEATGEVIGDYRDPDKPQPMINAGGGSIYDPNKNEWLSNPNAPAGGTANFDDISGIRKEVQALPSYKNLAQATPIYNAMAETASRDSRASDLNLVYGLGKIMDPTSVVREGEMFMVQGINTLPDKLIEGINSVLTGTSTLSPETRKAIMTEAYGRIKGYEEAFGKDAATYKGLADRYKINPDDILPGFDPLSPYQAPGDPVQITDDAGYDALPSGAIFIGPDGQTRRKP